VGLGRARQRHQYQYCQKSLHFASSPNLNCNENAASSRLEARTFPSLWAFC
jgi:hypothetical protein